MRSLRSLLVAAAAAAALSAAAGARPAPEATLSPSPAQRCLEPAEATRAKPVYPEDKLRMKEGGTYEAEFVFTAPDRAPKVNLHGNVDSYFARSIEAYAEQLRVPCMGAADRPVTLRQSFDFVPNDGRKVAWTAPSDSANAVREGKLKCVVPPQGDDAEIRYPDKMLREGREAVVVARVRFSAPDRAPEVELLDDGGRREFKYGPMQYMTHLRMPCVDAGSPVETLYYFQFRFEDGVQHRVLQDVGLATFLGSVKAVPRGSIFFDTTKMKCPFDARLTFKQPFDRNRVEELEEDVPARHAFLDWLAGLELVIPGRKTTDLIDQQMTIHIPCAQVDL
jgi:hypothetical protein